MNGYPFVYRDRVRFRDLDAMRHVNNAVFFTYFESARIAWMRDLAGGDAVEVTGIPMILARLEVDFRAPIDYGDDIEVGVRAARLGTKSFDLESEIHADGRVAAASRAVCVGYDYDTGDTIAIPDEWRRKLAA